MTPKPPPPPDRLNDPAFMAAQSIVIATKGREQAEAPPEGEVIYRDGPDTVRLTPDRWCVYINPGQGYYYLKRKGATDELVRALRGETGSRVIRPMKPVLRDR